MHMVYSTYIKFRCLTIFIVKTSLVTVINALIPTCTYTKYVRKYTCMLYIAKNSHSILVVVPNQSMTTLAIVGFSLCKLAIDISKMVRFYQLCRCFTSGINHDCWMWFTMSRNKFTHDMDILPTVDYMWGCKTLWNQAAQLIRNNIVSYWPHWRSRKTGMAFNGLL